MNSYRIDALMDTLASGFIPAGYYSFCHFTEQSGFALVWSDSELTDGIVGPCISWNEGFIYDLKYQKTTRLNPSFRMFIPFDNTSL